MERLTQDEIYDIASDLGIDDPELSQVLVQLCDAVCDRIETVNENLGICWGIEDAEYEELDCEDVLEKSGEAFEVLGKEDEGKYYQDSEIIEP